MASKHRLDLLVVDGYNVIFKSERYMARMDRSGVSDPFEQARELLISDVAAYATGKYEPSGVFAAAEERLVPRAVTVVTSDSTIRATVGGIPVTKISSDVLVHDVDELAVEYERENASRQHQRMTLEDRLSPDQREKPWKLRRQ